MKFLATTLLLVLFELVECQRRPPNYSQEQMPVTSFNCRDKLIGGYYADPETDCQMFHVCVKVPGHGVQDFKFLCPNDTSFDQENQICDDWYNIDCETSTLFYSDNFDLYRLGSEAGSRVKTTNVNNAVSDVEDGLYLQQKNDRGENVGKDLLRGSQSSNFFSNRGGRDEEDDLGKDELYKPKKKVVNKTQVRKLVTNKRPVHQTTTTTTTTEAYRPPTQRGLGNRNFRGQHVLRQQETTVQPSTQTYQPRQREYFTARPTTTQQQQVYETSQTQRPDFFRTNYVQQTTRSESLPVTTQRTNWQGNYNGNQFQRGNSNYNNNYQGTTVQPQPQYQNNAQTTQKQTFYQGTTYRPNYFETTQQQNNQHQQQAQPTQKPSFYNNFNIPTTTTQRPAVFNNFNAQTTTTQRPAFYNNFNGQTSTTRQNYEAPQQTSTPASTTFDYYSQGQETNNNYETQKLYRINLGAAVGVQPPRHNSDLRTQASPDDESADEFLSVAHSQNLAASAFNNRIGLLNGKSGYNTSVSTTYVANTPPPNPAATKPTEKPRPFTTQPNQVKKTGGQPETTAYDYAYYDDGTAAEYENVENVEEFSRTTARKRSA